jgi:hypothetical protein
VTVNEEEEEDDDDDDDDNNNNNNNNNIRSVTEHESITVLWNQGSQTDRFWLTG